MCGGTAAGCAGGTGDVEFAAGAECEGPPGKTPWAAIRGPGYEAMAPHAPAGRSLPDIIGRKLSSCRRRDVSRRGLSHVQGPRGPARSPVRNGDAPARLFWSSGRVQPPFFERHGRRSFWPSLLGAVGQCPFAVDRGSVAMGHLSWGAMATAPHSHAARRLRDQAIERRHFRRGARHVQRGGFHVHAEQDCERRSKARASQSMNGSLHGSFPPFSFLDVKFFHRPNPANGDGVLHSLNLAHLATPVAPARCRIAGSRVYACKGGRSRDTPALIR